MIKLDKNTLTDKSNSCVEYEYLKERDIKNICKLIEKEGYKVSEDGIEFIIYNPDKSMQVGYIANWEIFNIFKGIGMHTGKLVSICNNYIKSEKRRLAGLRKKRRTKLEVKLG